MHSQNLWLMQELTQNLKFLSEVILLLEEWKRYKSVHICKLNAVLQWAALVKTEMYTDVKVKGWALRLAYNIGSKNKIKLIVSWAAQRLWNNNKVILITLGFSPSGDNVSGKVLKY